MFEFASPATAATLRPRPATAIPRWTQNPPPSIAEYEAAIPGDLVEALHRVPVNDVQAWQDEDPKLLAPREEPDVDRFDLFLQSPAGCPASAARGVPRPRAAWHGRRTSARPRSWIGCGRSSPP
jgi:hypothetical protein